MDSYPTAVIASISTATSTTSNSNNSNQTNTEESSKLLAGQQHQLLKEDLLSEKDIHIVLTIVYLAIFIIGVIGNICNCLVIADIRNKYMKTATNYYLFSLSVSDLLLLIFGLPHDLVNLWHPTPYLFNEFVCVSRGWISEASTYASVLVIVAFTVERYLAICHPLKMHTFSGLSRPIKIIILIWLVASSCALFVAKQFGVITTQELASNGQYLPIAQCTLVAKNITIFELSVLIFFILPMAVLTILYVKLGYHLRQKAKVVKKNRLNRLIEVRNSSCAETNNLQHNHQQHHHHPQYTSPTMSPISLTPSTTTNHQLNFGNSGSGRPKVELSSFVQIQENSSNSNSNNNNNNGKTRVVGLHNKPKLGEVELISGSEDSYKTTLSAQANNHQSDNNRWSCFSTLISTIIPKSSESKQEEEANKQVGLSFPEVKNQSSSVGVGSIVVVDRGKRSTCYDSGSTNLVIVENMAQTDDKLDTPEHFSVSCDDGGEVVTQTVRISNSREFSACHRATSGSDDESSESNGGRNLEQQQQQQQQLNVTPHNKHKHKQRNTITVNTSNDSTRSVCLINGIGHQALIAAEPISVSSLGFGRPDPGSTATSTSTSNKQNHQQQHQQIALHSTVNAANMQSIIKMLVSVVVMFFICWAPFHAQRLMAIYVTNPTPQQTTIFELLNHISGISYYISAVANPILYSLFSVKFRQAFRDTFGTFWGLFAIRSHNNNNNNNNNGCCNELK